MVYDDIFVNDVFFDVGLGGECVYEVEYQFFENDVKILSIDVFFDCFVSDCVESIFGEFQFDVFEFEYGFVLMYEVVFGFGEDVYQCVFVELFEGSYDGEMVDEFWDEFVFYQVFGQGVLQESVICVVFGVFDFGIEVYGFFVEVVFDLVFEIDEGVVVDEEDVCCIDLEKFLMWVFVFVLGWDVVLCVFENFEQSLLYVFVGYVVGD